MRSLPLLLAAGGVLAIAAPASAEIINHLATVAPSNGSSVTGTVTAVHDTELNQVTINVDLSGLTPNQRHIQHIHGLFAESPVATSGTPVNSVVAPPTADLDTDGAGPDLGDGDGFVEDPEGLPFYGEAIVPLTIDGSFSLDLEAFPLADADGNLVFTQTYAYAEEVLGALDLRLYQIHGRELPEGAGEGPNVEGFGRAGEVFGQGGYIALLGVGAGEFAAVGDGADVPEPAALGLFGLGLLGIGAMRRRKR